MTGSRFTFFQLERGEPRKLMADRQYLNLEQAAFFVNETEEQLIQWLRDGQGPTSFERGGKRLYHIEDLRQFAESQKNMDQHYMSLSVG